MSEAEDVKRAADAALAPPAPAEKSRAKSIALTLGKVAIAAGLIAWLFTSGRFKLDDFRVLSGAPGVLAFSLFAVGANVVLAAVRWWLLVRGEGIHMPLVATVRISLIGNFFNTFMPGAIGGDPFKVYYAAAFAPPGKGVEAGTTVVVDRAVGLLALLLILAAAVVVLPLLGWHDAAFDKVLSGLSAYYTARVAIPLIVLAAVGAVGLALLMNPAIRRTPTLQAAADRVPGARLLWRVFKSGARTATRPWTTLAALACALVGHAMTIALFLSIARALGDTMDIQRYLLIIPIGLIIHVLPATPGGLGIGEAAFSWLFEAAGSVGSIGSTACAVWHAITLVYQAVGGVVYAMEKRATEGDA